MTTKLAGIVSAYVVGVLAVALCAAPAGAQTFSGSNPASITINNPGTAGPAGPYPSTINVAGLSGTITAVTVTLTGISHTFPDDVDMLLVGPGGQSLVVLSDVGGGTDLVGVNLTLDDAAAGLLPDGGPVVSGTFRPTDIGATENFPAPAPAGPWGLPATAGAATLASIFSGTAPNGDWSLFCVDDLGADDGNMAGGWAVTVTTTVDPATTFSNPGAIRLNDRRGTASLYPSTITIVGAGGVINSGPVVTLTDLSHLNPDDLDILLVGPTGASIFLASDAGGATDIAAIDLVIDDAAAAALPDATVLTSGTFRPTNFGTPDTVPGPLAPYGNPAPAGTATLSSVFDGTDPNGVWSLYIVDDATASAGTLAGGWAIDGGTTPVELLEFKIE